MSVRTVRCPQFLQTTLLNEFKLIRAIRASSTQPDKSSTQKIRTLIEPKEQYPLKLIEKVELNQDTRRFRFALPSPRHFLGLPIGQHIYLTTTINNKLTTRPYTPLTDDDTLGHMDLVIKGVNPLFPDGGLMGQYLNDMPIGSAINCRGPGGELLYKGKGEFEITAEGTPYVNTFQIRKVNMLAGGSGITPMLQLIKAIFKDKDDSTEMSLIFANQTEADILLRAELETLQGKYPDRFKLWYTLDRAPPGWKFSTGFISEEMMRANLYPPSEDTLVLMCGPLPMIEIASIPNLEKIGYDENLRFVY